jgi:hypothetical protein
VPVVSPDRLRDEDPSRCKVIIATHASASFMAIAGHLVSLGFVPEEDFTSYRHVVLYWGQYYQGQMILPYVELMITSHCSLNCKQCGLYIPYFNHRSHRSLAAMRDDLARLFSHVDHLLTLHLLGGEPFLHPELDALVAHVGGRYRTRIRTVRLVTNGTVLPSDRLLSLCREHAICVQISNYSKTLPRMAPKIQRLVAQLEKHHVEYENRHTPTWWDVGSPVRRQNLTARQLQQRFDDCRMPCRSLYDSKLFYCGAAASSVMGQLRPGDRGEYFDLNQPGNDTSQRTLSLFELGHTRRGFLNSCRYCNGFGSLNKMRIPAAEQVSQ